MKLVTPLLVWFFLSAGLALAAETPAAPRLAIDEAVWEAADIEPGRELRHEFKLRNTGEAPLILKDVRTGCSCAAVEYDRSIPPGGEGRLTVAVQIYKEWAGRELRRAVWLSTNDPDLPEARLIIRGRVAEPAVP